MKKIIILLFMLFVLTGCSTKLKCKINTDRYKSKITIKYKEDKPIKYLFKDRMIFDIKDKNKDIYYKRKQTEYKSLINNYSAKVINKNKKVISSVNYNFKKDINSYLLIDKNDNIKSSIIKIESIGYRCN